MKIINSTYYQVSSEEASRIIYISQNYDIIINETLEDLVIKKMVHRGIFVKNYTLALGCVFVHLDLALYMLY